MFRLLDVIIFFSEQSKLGCKVPTKLWNNKDNVSVINRRKNITVPKNQNTHASHLSFNQTFLLTNTRHNSQIRYYCTDENDKQKYWESQSKQKNSDTTKDTDYFSQIEQEIQGHFGDDVKVIDDSQLTHIDASGKAKMVDVGHKNNTDRTAVATSTIELGSEVFKLVKENKMKKGDALTVAQLAGIMAAKHTSDLVPLCHNIPITSVHVSFEMDETCASIHVTAMVKTSGKTGVEMEAITAASVAAITIYDMCKAVSRDMVITNVRLESKTGGVRGDYMRSK